MMTPSNQLQANVHQLVNEHTERHTSTFRFEGVTFTEQGHGTVPPLITQLRDSIHPSMDGKAGGSKGRSSLINAAALNLYDRISDQAAAGYVALAKVAPKPTVEGNIRAWMAWSIRSERLTGIAVETTSTWVQEIKTLLNPARQTEIIGACPACGNAKYEAEQDGEPVPVPALTAIGDTVTCYCGATWSGSELHRLKDALDTGPVAVA